MTCLGAKKKMAYYDDYFTMGFAAGSQKKHCVTNSPDCQALEGKECRNPNMSRSLMEAFGFDAYRM